MNLQEIYLQAKKDNYPSLCLLIEFLVLEKEVLTWLSGRKELDLYLKPNNKPRMNKLLLEYREGLK